MLAPDLWFSDGVAYPKPAWFSTDLLPKLVRWASENRSSEFGSTLSLLPVEKYSVVYQQLKEKYKAMVKVKPTRVSYKPPPSFQFRVVSHTIVVSVGLAGGDGSREVCVRRRCHSDVSPGKSNRGCQSFVLSGPIVVETHVASAKWVSRLDAGR